MSEHGVISNFGKNNTKLRYFSYSFIKHLIVIKQEKE